MLLASLVVAYVSGRLNRIEKNKKLLIIVGLLLLADALIDTFLGSYSFLFRMLVGHFTPLFTLTALGFAYTARFEEHKSAGIE